MKFSKFENVYETGKIEIKKNLYSKAYSQDFLKFKEDKKAQEWKNHRRRIALGRQRNKNVKNVMSYASICILKVLTSSKIIFVLWGWRERE